MKLKYVKLFENFMEDEDNMQTNPDEFEVQANNNLPSEEIEDTNTDDENDDYTEDREEDIESISGNHISPEEFSSLIDELVASGDKEGSIAKLKEFFKNNPYVLKSADYLKYVSKFSDAYLNDEHEEQ